MTLQQKESKWRIALCLFAAYALFACSDDKDVPNIDDEEPPVTEISVPTPNTYLAAEHYSITHFNSAQTDAFPYAVKSGDRKSVV